MSIFDVVTETDRQLDPWDEALPGMRSAMDLLKGDPWSTYQGDWIADLNAMQQQGLGGTAAFGAGGMQDLGDKFMGTGEDMLGAFGGAQDFYGDALGWDAITQEGPDMGQVAMMADNPYMTGMIDAASRDVSRNLYENQMPGIAAYSAGSGNLGSSRRGMAEGIASRGVADRVADIGAGLRGSAYERALGLESDRQGRNANLALSNRTQGLGAAQGLTGIGDSGANLMTSGAGIKRSGYGDVTRSGDRYQAQSQSEIDALKRQFDDDQMLPYDQSKAAMDILFEPAKAFGDWDQEVIEKYDGSEDLLALLLGGGGGGGAGNIGEILGEGGLGGLVDRIGQIFGGK